MTSITSLVVRFWFGSVDLDKARQQQIIKNKINLKKILFDKF